MFWGYAVQAKEEMNSIVWHRIPLPETKGMRAFCVMAIVNDDAIAFIAHSDKAGGSGERGREKERDSAEKRAQLHKLQPSFQPIIESSQATTGREGVLCGDCRQKTTPSHPSHMPIPQQQARRRAGEKERTQTSRLPKLRPAHQDKRQCTCRRSA